MVSPCTNLRGHVYEEVSFILWARGVARTLLRKSSIFFLTRPHDGVGRKFLFCGPVPTEQTPQGLYPCEKITPGGVPQCFVYPTLAATHDA